MNDAITPSEQELRAATLVAVKALTTKLTPDSNANLATIIAAHTRYEGKAADEIATMWVRELARAEAAEAALNQERAKHHVQYHSALNELAKAQARVKELEQMPCDSTQANKWLNANAPTNVLQSLWAWRRIAEDGLALRDKRIAGLEAAAVECGEVTVGNGKASDGV